MILDEYADIPASAQGFLRYVCDEAFWLVTVLCTGRNLQHRPRGARACLVGLFGRPGVSAFRIRKEGHWGGKGIEFDC
jgi:hypothetical protein